MAFKLCKCDQKRCIRLHCYKKLARVIKRVKFVDGFKVYFTNMDTLMRKLKESESKQKAYLTSCLVVIDEVGYLPVDSNEAYLFFQFVFHRYERNSTIITSNKSFSDSQELFGDPVIATAILDRMLHHCKVVNIKGHSYRLKEHSTVKEQLERKENNVQLQSS